MKINKILTGLIVIILVFSSLIMAYGDNASFEPPTGFTDPEKYYSVYIRPDGNVRSDSILIPIMSTYLEQGIVGALLFPNVTISQHELINNANLTLWFDGDLEESTEDLFITVYGADAVFTPGSNLAGIDAGFPITTKFINVNLKNITSAQWVTVDVTEIVQEIINKYAWSPGAGIGFLIYGAPTDTARSYQSNVGTKGPVLEVNYGVAPTGGPSYTFEEQYRDYIIYSTYTDEFTGFLYSNGANVYLDAYSYEQPTGWDLYTLPATSLYDGSGSTSNQGVVVGDKIYAILSNVTRSDFWYANLTDLSSWARIGILHNSQPCDYSITFNEDEGVIYLFHLAQIGSGYFKTYNIVTKTLSASEAFLTSAYTNTGIDSTYDPINGTVWVASTAADSTGSARHLYIDVFNDGTTNRITKFNPSVAANMDNPHITIYGDEVFVFYRETNDVYFQRRKADLSDDWTLTDSFNNKAGYSELYQQSNRVIYVTSDNGADAEKDYVSITVSPYSKTEVTATANITGVDQYLCWAIPWYGVNTLFVEHEQTDKYYSFSAPGLLTAGAGYEPPYDLSLYWSYFEVNSFGVGDMDSVATIASQTGHYVYYVYFNNTLIDTADSVEEAENLIDDLLGGPPLDNPTPDGWDASGPFSRARIRLYFFIIGWAFVWVPLWIFALVHGFDRFRVFFIMLFAILIGLCLLWSIPGI